MLAFDKPALILAPMEGVTDAPMRALQGEAGAFNFAVSEFYRVHHFVPHRSSILRHVPELGNGGRTPSGLAVQVQLLGGDAGRMAEAAGVACEAGATAIDLNFGCPARTVNRHDGGASLLRHPKRIRDIVAAVRAVLPRSTPVSAKLRLGWDTIDSIFENADMAAEGGAAWLTIHARTRVAGYAPPVYWTQIGRVRERLKLPIVANGDIWTIADFQRCREETGCRHFMLGRGALADPNLARQIAERLGMPATAAPPRNDWRSQMQRLVEWTRRCGNFASDRTIYRLKQWLSLAAKYGRFAGFDAIKRARNVEELLQQLA